MKEDSKIAAVDQLHLSFLFHPFCLLFFFTQKQHPPAGLSLCQSLSPSGSEASPGSVHRVLSIPPPGPHGHFPSMIQEFEVKDGKGGLWLSQVTVELKPEIGALVWSSGTLRKGLGWGQIRKSLRWQWAKGWNEGTHPALSNTAILTHLEGKERNRLDTFKKENKMTTSKWVDEKFSQSWKKNYKSLNIL